MNENRRSDGGTGSFSKMLAPCFLALACSCVAWSTGLYAGQGDADTLTADSPESCELPEHRKPIGSIGTSIRATSPLTAAEQRELSRCDEVFRDYGVLDYQSAQICHWWDYGSLAPLYPYCYQPLYFEDANLERCGYSANCYVQPFISGAHFFGTCGLLPFKMLAKSPCACVEPLSDCPPCQQYSAFDNYVGPFPERQAWHWPWNRDSR
jgi:hypothetical protein